MRYRRLALGGLGACAAVALWAAPAGAEVDGGCQATVAGQDVAPRSSSDPGQAIEVKSDDVIQVGATSPGQITGYKVKMAFAGFEWQVAEGDANGNSWQKTVNVKDYARFGVGLYKVKGQSIGETPCTGAVLIKITGKSPLTTVVGAGAAVLALGSLVGAVTGMRRSVALGPKLPPVERFGGSMIESDGITAMINRVSSPVSYVESIDRVVSAGANWPEVSSAVWHQAGQVRDVIATACRG